jgi:hypothetical protein
MFTLGPRGSLACKLLGLNWVSWLGQLFSRDYRNVFLRECCGQVQVQCLQQGTTLGAWIGNAQATTAASAHSRRRICFLSEAEDPVRGDVIVNRFFPIMPDADANGTNWIRMLERIEQLHPAIVVPGHGEVGDAGHRPDAITWSTSAIVPSS